MLASLWIPQNVKLQMKLYSATSAIATAFYSRAESAELTSTPEQALSASAFKVPKLRPKPTKKHRARELSTNRQFSSTRSIGDRPSRIRVGVDCSLNVVK